MSNGLSGSTVKSWFQYRCERKTRYEIMDPSELAAVPIAKDDREARAFGDMPKSRSPVASGFARPLRRDGEEEPVRLRDLSYVFRDQAMGGFPIDRAAAEPAHDPAERRAKQGVIAEERDLEARGIHRAHADQEIPIAGVGTGGDDHPGEVGQGAFHPPAEEPHRGVVTKIIS